MQTKPEVSVIVSTYNRASRLRECLTSILAQSLKNIEVIVVDDNSTDNTAEVVKRFDDKRIKYIKLPENHGYDSFPKNTGIKNATADVVAFIDDDDIYYKKEALKILHTYLVAGKADLVYGDYLNVVERDLSDLNSIKDIKNIFKKERQVGWSLDFNPQLLAQRNYIAMSVVMVKRDKVVEVGGFNENIKQFKDWNLWMRLHKNGCQFLHVPIIVTEVRQHKNTISSKNKLVLNPDGTYKPTFNSADCRIYADKTCMGEFKPLKVAVFTLTKDRLAFTKEMVTAADKTSNYPFEWIVVDNGSNDGTIEWIEDWAKENKIPVEFVD